MWADKQHVWLNFRLERSTGDRQTCILDTRKTTTLPMYSIYSQEILYRRKSHTSTSYLTFSQHGTMIKHERFDYWLDSLIQDRFSTSLVYVGMQIWDSENIKHISCNTYNMVHRFSCFVTLSLNLILDFISDSCLHHFTLIVYIYIYITPKKHTVL